MQEMISWVLITKIVNTNMYPILNGYGGMGAFK